MPTVLELVTEREPRLPYKFTPETVAALFKGADTGAPLQLIAECAGIDRFTLRVWLENPDKHPELDRFATEFRARRADAHMKVHQSVMAAGDGSNGERPDWRASAFLLQHMVEGYQAEHLGLGIKTQLNGSPELTPEQIKHRFVQSIAHPTKGMRDALWQAFMSGNDTLRQLVIDAAHKLAVETSGQAIEEGSEQLLTEALPPMTAELEGRLAVWEGLLRTHARVALGGGPKTGKTKLFSRRCTDRPVVHTDTHITGPVGAGRRSNDVWAAEADAAKQECDRHAGPLLVEGVRVTGVIAAGLQVDVLVWLSKPLVQLTPGQETMRKGRETRLLRFKAERPDVKVVVV